jgi:hypothetical protein
VRTQRGQIDVIDRAALEEILQAITQNKRLAGLIALAWVGEQNYTLTRD